jgi:hypothetical protein
VLVQIAKTTRVMLGGELWQTDGNTGKVDDANTTLTQAIVATASEYELQNLAFIVPLLCFSIYFFEFVV